MVIIGEHLERLVGSLKSKLRSLKAKNHYDKVVKTDSMRMEMKSRRARKLIARTLKAADSPGRGSNAC